MKLEGKKVLVVGAGKSGIAASELLLDKKIETVLYDGNKDLDVEKLYEKAPKLKGMPVLLGELTDEQLRAFDVAVLSPGVPTDLPVVERMRAQNVCIWGEITCIFLRKRQTDCNHRNKRKDHYDSIDRRNHEKLFQGCARGWKYRNSVYFRGCHNDG